jgi:prophage regulatory protein
MSILRLPAVLAVTGHRSHNSIYTAIRAGLFTKQVQIGQRSVGWPAGEVEAINAARIAGKSDDEIRRLVVDLHSRRTMSESSIVPNASVGQASLSGRAVLAPQC